MGFEAIIQGNTHTLTLEVLPESKYRLGLDGQSFDTNVQCLPGNVFSVLVDGRHQEFALLRGPDGMEIEVDGHRCAVEIIDPRRKLAGSGLGSNGGQTVVKGSMPGKVIGLLVKEGDIVEKGDGLIVLEAMKMQNELKAKNAGVVKRFYVAEGDKVEANAPLVLIEDK